MIVDPVAFPDFSQAPTRASIEHVVTFALVGSIESTPCVLVVDAPDPAKRMSKLNRDVARGAPPSRFFSAAVAVETGGSTHPLAPRRSVATS